MKNSWIRIKKKQIDSITNKYNITNVTETVLYNRDFLTDYDINFIFSDDLNDLNDENLLPDIIQGVDFIVEKISQNKKIKIIGDYDADGICATYILYDGLKRIGANVSFIIPDRVKDGYGINKSIIDICISENIDVIITCDNGISAREEISYAKVNGISVVVTDHHDIVNLPTDAIAIINPKRKDKQEIYPFSEICGAVVAYKFIKKLYSSLNIDFDYKKYLPFATIATICDIMPLINENHLLVKKGLEIFKETENKGLKKLIEINELSNKEINSFVIGFIIGPMINASGRLKTAMIALQLFISDDENEIQQIANELKLLNDERKKETDIGFKEACLIYDEKYKNDKIIILYLDKTNESVAGIIAGRIKDSFNKPTIILTKTNEVGILKASCRSIDEYDMFSNLSQFKELFIKFGGHKLAAGFSIKTENLDLLRQQLNRNCSLTDDDLIKKIYYDFGLNIEYITKELVLDLNKLKPFGRCNEKPIFLCRKLNYRVVNVYGSRQNVIKLMLKNDKCIIYGTIFDEIDEFNKKMEKKETIDILYNLDINEFNGIKNVDIVIKDYY